MDEIGRADGNGENGEGVRKRTMRQNDSWRDEHKGRTDEMKTK